MNTNLAWPSCVSGLLAMTQKFEKPLHRLSHSWLLLTVLVILEGGVLARGQSWYAGTVTVVNDTPYTLEGVEVLTVDYNGATNQNAAGVTPSTLLPGESGTVSNFFTGNSGQLPTNFPGNGYFGVSLYAAATEVVPNEPEIWTANLLPIANTTPSVSGVLYFNAAYANIDDLSDGAVKTPMGNDCGMPQWSVSTPYVSLWLQDEPLGYQPARGARVSFELSFDQREFVTGWNPAVFSLGPRWNFSWYSCVAQDANSNNVVYFPGGGQRTYFTTNDYLTDTVLTGNTTNGFTLLYPDGSENIYGFVVTNTAGGLLNAYLTESLDPQGQGTFLTYYGYNPTNPVVQLESVVDADGRTTSIYYATNNPYSANLISEVMDPFGRHVNLGYDDNGHLTNITDVGGISSSFLYDTNINCVTNLITPYGTTAFSITDTSGTEVAPNGRSVLATDPDGGQQLYLYEDNAPGVASSYASSAVPSTSPLANTFDTNSLNVRNTFHWGRLQYSALSTNVISAFTTNDILKAHMQHWLAASTTTVGETLSIERNPSPDSVGTIEGQKTWYDYAGKTNTGYEGTQVMPLFVARVLPNGTTAFAQSQRNRLGLATNLVGTYSLGGSVALRTNTFTYATNGIDLITATNALGIRAASNSYNAYHQVLTNIDALNEITIYTYNTNQQITGIKWPSGLVTTNTYGTNGFLSVQADIGVTTNSFTYSNELILTFTDPLGLVVSNTWDNLQRLTSQTYPDGTYISNIYTFLDLTAKKDRLNHWTYLDYDPLEHLTVFTNANTNLTTFDWCGCGLLKAITNALTNVTAFSYDNEARLTNVSFADTSSLTYQYDLLGNITNVSDGSGRSIASTYNAQGLVTNVSNSFGSVLKVTYDNMDRPQSVTDASSVTVTNAYDVLNRIILRSWPSNFSEGFGYATNGLIAYTNRDQKVTHFGRDSAERLTSVTNANQEVTQFGYNALDLIASLTDGNLHQTTFQYNQFGWLTNKLNNSSNSVLQLAYDANGRVTNRWMPATGNTAYAFDALGNLTNISYPGNATSPISFVYDKLNELTNMFDAIGVTAFSYTPTGQLQSEAGPWTSDTVSYAYYQSQRTNLTINSSPPSTISYTYDSAWRLAGLTSSAGAFAYGYGASPSTLVQSIALPNFASISNSYDALSRFSSTALVSFWGHILDGSTYAYGQPDLRTGITRNLGLTTNSVAIGYDSIGQINSWTGTESGGAARLNEQLGYGYDSADNLHLRTNGALIQTFTVDPLNQLTNVSRTGALTLNGAIPAPATNITVNGQTAQTYGDFTFARTNNSLINGANSFTVIAQNVYGVTVTNALSLNLPATVSLQYDANGNLTNDGTRSFVFDAENHLTNVNTAGAWKTEFVYDGLGRERIARDYTWQGGNWVKTNETRFVCDGVLAIQERNSNNAVQVTYTRGSDLSGSLSGAGGIGGLLARTDTNGSTFYHADGAGNITSLIDDNQNIVARYEYDAFGRLIGEWGVKASVNTMQFSSMPRDAQSGLVLFPTRPYEPNFGRFLSHDQIGEGGGINLYAFVGNSPLNRGDPLGLAWYDYIPGLGVGIEEAQGAAAVQAQLGRASYNGQVGFDSLQQFNLAHKNYQGGYTSGDLSTVQAGANVAGGATSLYVNGATMLGQAGIATKGAEAAAQGIADAAEEGWLSKLWNKCFGKEPSVWTKPPFPRGRAIEKLLGGNLPDNFPVIDKFIDGVATSIKSIDLNATTYQDVGALASKIDSYVDKVADFNGARFSGVNIQAGDISARQLQLAVPAGGVTPAQQAAINASVARAQGMGVSLIVSPVR
jgi:RHS repeat-associated protein